MHSSCVLDCQAISPKAAVDALGAAERHPWMPGCGSSGSDKPCGLGRLAGLPIDSKLLVAQVRFEPLSKTRSACCTAQVVLVNLADE